MPFPQPHDRLAFAQALGGSPRKLRTNAPNAALSPRFEVACSLAFAICHFALPELQPGLGALCTAHESRMYLPRTSHVPRMHLACTSHALGLYLACTSHALGFGRLCPAFLHSALCLLHSSQGGFGVALVWL